MNAKTVRTAFFLLTLPTLFACALAAAEESGVERLNVPLSDPSRPATVKVSLINGGIEVEGYDGKEVQVEARPRERAEGSRRAQGSERERGGRAQGMRIIPNTSLGLSVEEEKNVVSVESESWRRAADLKIRVPVGSALNLTCVNDGDIVVRGVRGDLELSNTNGSIDVREAGSTVIANTVNGHVKVTFVGVPAGRPMAFSSLNGDVDVTLPPAFGADVRLSTQNGEIYSDFEVAMRAPAAKPAPERSGGRYRIVLEKEMLGRIGAGGPEVLFKTFNGDIFIRRTK